MTIRVKYEASQTQRRETFNIQDLDLTTEDWNEMSEDEKREVLMDAIIEQPYWSVDTFTESE